MPDRAGVSSIEWFDELGSTSDLARERGHSGLLGPTWIAARCQSRGRGRLGRDWISPQGNLYATFLSGWQHDLELAAKVSFAAGLAVETCLGHWLAGRSTHSGLKLKWPNDVLHEGAKLAGILVETGEGDAGRWLSVGVGMNLAIAPEVEGRATVSLAAILGEPAPAADVVLTRLSGELDARIAELATGRFEAMRRAWLARAFGLGGPVSVRLDGMSREGIFETLDANGALVVAQADGTRHTITAGEVHVLGQV